MTLPDDSVSRYHCLLEIDPPYVQVSDCGSFNGTFLNGKLIGRREDKTPNPAQKFYPMKSGDRLGLGTKCEFTLEIGCMICGETLTGEECDIKICHACLSHPERIGEFLLKMEIKRDDDVKEIAGYQIVKKLGKGGMGIVWLVKESPAGEEKALKVMIQEDEAFKIKNEDSEAIKRNKARFLREAYVGRQLKHEHIVPQYKNGKYHNIHYILMAYCKGGNVEKLIEKRGLIDEKLATFIILQVLEALHYAHHVRVKAIIKDGRTVKVNGVVHRDIKPANILLSDNTSSPVAKVADFGLTKTFATAGDSGITPCALTGKPTKKVVAGDLQFMPRQQLRDFLYAKPDVDVWAAAATYYKMLTGLPPKDFTRYKGQPEKVVFTHAVPIQERNPHINDRLAEVIDAALIDDPEIGMSSILELKKNIETAVMLKLLSISNNTLKINPFNSFSRYRQTIGLWLGKQIDDSEAIHRIISVLHNL